MSIGENIKKYRKKRKITQKELAKLINKTESSVRKYEAGTTNVPLDVLNDIADKLGIKTYDLISDGFDYEFGANTVDAKYLLSDNWSEEDCIKHKIIINSFINNKAALYSLKKTPRNQLDIIQRAALKYLSEKDDLFLVKLEIERLLSHPDLENKFNYSFESLEKNNLDKILIDSIYRTITNTFEIIKNVQYEISLNNNSNIEE